MKCNKQLKYGNYVAFGHFHGTAVNNSGMVLRQVQGIYGAIFEGFLIWIFDFLLLFPVCEITADQLRRFFRSNRTVHT